MISVSSDLHPWPCLGLNGQGLDSKDGGGGFYLKFGLLHAIDN